MGVMSVEPAAGTLRVNQLFLEWRRLDVLQALRNVLEVLNSALDLSFN